ncbi:hypothetical protein ABPG74_003873 [Tetrahymena malaccensis]
MRIQVFLIFLSTITSIIASVGSNVSCNQGTSTCSVQNCSTVPNGCTWQVTSGQSAPNCQIQECNCLTGGSVAGLTDLVCKSCGQNGAVYANVAGSQCVASSAPCQNRQTDWTTSDCKLCYPSQQSDLYAVVNKQCLNCSNLTTFNDVNCQACFKQYANSLQNSCVASSSSCLNRGQTAWNPQDCQLCYGSSYIFNTNTCQNCLVNTSLTDQLCSLCANLYGNKNNYSNSAGTSCIAASASCNSSSRGKVSWSTIDCALCSPNTPIVDSSGNCAAGIQASTTFSYILIYSISIIIVLFI